MILIYPVGGIQWILIIESILLDQDPCIRIVGSSRRIGIRSKDSDCRSWTTWLSFFSLLVINNKMCKEIVRFTVNEINHLFWMIKDNSMISKWISITVGVNIKYHIWTGKRTDEMKCEMNQNFTRRIWLFIKIPWFVKQ